MSTVPEKKIELNESVITREIAESEVNKWLDYKKVSKQKRILYKDQTEKLINAVMDGNLVLLSDSRFSQKLIFPIGEELIVSEFNYKARLKVGLMEEHVKSMKNNDMISVTRAYLCALSNQPKEIINEIDTEDYSIASAIAVFFM